MTHHRVTSHRETLMRKSYENIAMPLQWVLYTHIPMRFLFFVVLLPVQSILKAAAAKRKKPPQKLQAEYKNQYCENYCSIFIFYVPYPVCCLMLDCLAVKLYLSIIRRLIRVDHTITPNGPHKYSLWLDICWGIAANDMQMFDVAVIMTVYDSRYLHIEEVNISITSTPLYFLTDRPTIHLPTHPISKWVSQPTGVSTKCLCSPFCRVWRPS